MVLRIEYRCSCRAFSCVVLERGLKETSRWLYSFGFLFGVLLLTLGFECDSYYILCIRCISLTDICSRCLSLLLFLPPFIRSVLLCDLSYDLIVTAYCFPPFVLTADPTATAPPTIMMQSVCPPPCCML